MCLFLGRHVGIKMMFFVVLGFVLKFGIPFCLRLTSLFFISNLRLYPPGGQPRETYLGLICLTLFIL